MKRKRLSDMAETAVMSALISVCAMMSVPAAVPFTLQTFGVFLALIILGGAKGLASVAVYILIGAAGAPVFSGFRGGVSVIAGPTGGYIIGFIPLCLIYLAVSKFSRGRAAEILSLAAGLVVCYAFGTVWFAAVSGTSGMLDILSVCVFPFIIPDAVKLVAALTLGRKTRALLSDLHKTAGAKNRGGDTAGADFGREEYENEKYGNDE